MDKWTIAANQHLLAHLIKNLAAAKRMFPDSIPRSSRHPKDGRLVDWGPVTERNTQKLVAFKNAWAEDMRADDKGSGVPIEAQQQAWADCMARAEAEIARQEAE